MHLRWLTAVFAAGIATGAAQAAHFTSGTARVTLIELYTSEGCSSCPPAEKWLGELRDDPRLWTEVVPVAFHVHYWDYIGWKDRFASRDFTERQRAIARSWRAGQVYTPCFVRNGEEWRSRNLARGVGQRAGELMLDYDGGGQVRVSFRPVEPSGEFDVAVALLGGGVTSNVRAGENAGRNLTHEFVALSLDVMPLTAAPDGSWSGEMNFSASEAPATPRRALAAWVTRRGDLAPLQATGGWLQGS